MHAPGKTATCGTNHQLPQGFGPATTMNRHSRPFYITFQRLGHGLSTTLQHSSAIPRGSTLLYSFTLPRDPSE